MGKLFTRWFEVPAQRWLVALLVALLGIHIHSWLTRPLSIEQIADNSIGSVVIIECDQGKNISTTAGFVASDYGHIVTVAHGLYDCLGKREKNLIVRYWDDPEKEYRAKIIRYNASEDIGVIQVPSHLNVTPLKIDSRDELPLGSRAIAIGHPQLLYWSVTSGIISADRMWTDGSRNKHIIQVSSLINQGNSGGPILGDDGKVIGIASFNIGGNPTLGFIAPNDRLRMFLPEYLR